MKKGSLLLVLILTILVLTSLALALSPEQYKEIRNCKKSCNIDEKQELLKIKSGYEDCYSSCIGKGKQKCRFSCSDEKNLENDKIKFKFENCQKNCEFKVKNPEAKCLLGKYNAGDIFLEGCKICRCDYNEKIYCKKTPYCNFDNVKINEEYCINTNGLYQQLCNGPYFDIVCSKSSFCICRRNI